MLLLLLRQPIRPVTIILFLSFFHQIIHAQGIYQNWGVTYTGGPDDIGVIFSTDSAGGNLRARHAFSYINKGDSPDEGALTLLNGKLYGLTYTDFTDSNNSYLFEYDPVSGKYTVKATIPSFNSELGAEASGGLTVFNNELYGTAAFGGTSGNGVFFKYRPADNTFTVLYNFDSTGFLPNGFLTLYNNKFYGLTARGGDHDGGVLFEYDPVVNIYTKRIDVFTSGGRSPVAGLMLYNNKFYGTTYFYNSFTDYDTGGLFEYDPGTNQFTSEVHFPAVTGKSPVGNLLLYQNKLWGVKYTGGANGDGVLFQFDPSTGTVTTKYDFTADGSNPSGGLLLAGNKFLGLTAYGGDHNLGTLFEYDPASGAYSKKIDFSSSFKGANPGNDLTFVNDKLYGSTWYGGTENQGVIFNCDTSDFTYTKKLDFGFNHGSYPSGSLTYFNQNLYGVTNDGGDEGEGTLFKYDLNAKTFSTELNFDTILGAVPTGDLLLYNSKFYGVTLQGGTYNRGTLFSYDPSNKAYNRLFSFDSINGANIINFDPLYYHYSPLLLYNNKFYGTTEVGGKFNYGVLFEFDPALNLLTKKFDFDSISGKTPSGGLSLVNNKIYGIAISGGANDDGILFEFDPLNSQYVPKHVFSRPDELSQSSGLYTFDNKLYSVSAYGGNSQQGFLFEYDPVADNYNHKLNFDSGSGSNPFSGLLLRNNLFYGMTFKGGMFNKGVVFQYNPVTNNYIKKTDFDSTNTGAGADAGQLISVPAFVADGNLGACMDLPPQTIDNTNNNQWIGLTDQFGNAIGEIFPNGNDLGTVTAFLFVQSNPVRVAGGLNYLNRSLTISVQHQPLPGQPVGVRLYIKKSELYDLINTPGSGVSSVNDLSVYKSESRCSDTIGSDVVKLTTGAEEWGPNYVLTTQVNSFSTFHFGSGNLALPVTIVSFTANHEDKTTNRVDWETTAEDNTDHYSIEKSMDGFHFTNIGAVPAAGNRAIKNKYEFIDASGNGEQVYYRLKIVDKDGSFKYSPSVKLTGILQDILISPDPVGQWLNIQGSRNYSHVQILNASGKVIHSLPASPTNQYNVSDLNPGIYLLRCVSGGSVIVKKFIKM